MNKKITGILIDTEANTAKAVTIDNTLEAFYSALHCSCIDIVERTIGESEKYFTIVCDDEGLLKAAPCISAVSDLCEPMLVGSLLITDFDHKTGDLASLSERELEYVLDHIIFTVSSRRTTPFPLLCQVGY